MSGVPESSLSHYIQTLQALDLVEQRIPALTSPHGRQARYYLCDPFLRFYYRFIVPQLTSIERGMMDAVTRAVRDDLRAFIRTYTFKELCREWVWAAANQGSLGFIPEAVEGYWGRTRGKGIQLDVVAASRRDKRLFIGEAKWGKGAVSRNTLTGLVQRSHRMPQVKEGWQVAYGLFAREGFTPALVEEAKHTGARLVDLEELEQTLVQAARHGDMAATNSDFVF